MWRFGGMVSKNVLPRCRASSACRSCLPAGRVYLHGTRLLEQAPDVLLGTYLGAAGDPAITEMVEEADALLLLGVIFSDTNFALSQHRLDARRIILAFDRTVRIGHHVYTDLPIDDLI